MPSPIILRRTSLVVILACISFYAGYIISSSDEGAYKNNQTGIDSSINFHSGNRDILVQNRLLHHFESHNGQVPNDKKELMQHFLLHQCSHGKNGNSHTQQLQQIKLEAQQRAASRLRKLNNNTKVPKNHNDDSPFFPPKSMSKFLSGMARISKRDIMKEFDNFGVAILESPTYPNGEEEEAWLLYNTVDSFPSDKRQQEAVAHGAHDLEAIDNNKNAENQQTPTRLPKITNLTAALENCDVLNVQFTHNPSGDAHPMCHLWIPSETMPSFHVDRWMKGLGEKQVLQHVPALTNPKGANAFELPRYHPLISKHWEALRRFLDHAEEVLEEIRSLIEDRMGLLNHIDPGNDNTIIVMTVNQGQSDLLTNFLCAAKSRQLDVRRVLVFVTDEESKLLVERLSKDGGKDNLGVMVYYDKWNMEDLPKGDAGVKYGDSTFTSMMLAKVCALSRMCVVRHAFHCVENCEYGHLCLSDLILYFPTIPSIHCFPCGDVCQKHTLLLLISKRTW